MKIIFTIEEKDYLTHLLYFGSKSELVRKKRTLTFITPLFSFIIGGGFLFFKDRIQPAIGFLVGAIAWLIVYPSYQKRQYIDHYKKVIRKTYSANLGKEFTIELNHEFIFAKTNGSESKTAITEIEKFIEIPSHFLIKIKSGHSFILPKDKIQDIQAVRSTMNSISSASKIEFVSEENWEWK
jgi:hypothetical protein